MDTERKLAECFTAFWMYDVYFCVSLRKKEKKVNKQKRKEKREFLITDSETC